MGAIDGLNNSSLSDVEWSKSCLEFIRAVQCQEVVQLLKNSFGDQLQLYKTSVLASAEVQYSISLSARHVMWEKH